MFICKYAVEKKTNKNFLFFFVDCIAKHMKQEKKYAVLSLSGGMDSSTLLLHLLNPCFLKFNANS